MLKGILRFFIIFWMSPLYRIINRGVEISDLSVCLKMSRFNKRCRACEKAIKWGAGRKRRKSSRGASRGWTCSQTLGSSIFHPIPSVEHFCFLNKLESTLGDLGADSGAREIFFALFFLFARSDIPLPHYLPLGSEDDLKEDVCVCRSSLFKWIRG